MSDPREPVVVVALMKHCLGNPYPPTMTELARVAIAALDAYAATVPFSGRIPQTDPTWANEAHPTPEPGAPGAVLTYAERMGRG